ncbi:YaiI/YqxD family protein [Planctomicrobium sp. SH668]|uniref:YaiI/YqxD family protein n=1 Tax=Planctomicrobium sp. SH668 TaxID=3448126 RepID=UPI003F5C21AA
MQIWIDADACPGDAKEILFRTAVRRQVSMTLVANQPMHPPRSEFLNTLLVGSGANVADQKIVELLQPGDLVITADIPLAANVVAKGGEALDPRGHLYDRQTIGERLAVRDLLDELRASGEISGGPKSYGAKEKQAFANQLDRWLTKSLRKLRVPPVVPPSQ